MTFGTTCKGKGGINTVRGNQKSVPGKESITMGRLNVSIGNWTTMEICVLEDNKSTSGGTDCEMREEKAAGSEVLEQRKKDSRKGGGRTTELGWVPSFPSKRNLY